MKIIKSKTKVKGKWSDFDYCVSGSMDIEKVKKSVENGVNQDLEFIGKSKVIKYPNGNIRHLKTRFSFFRITTNN